MIAKLCIRVCVIYTCTVGQRIHAARTCGISSVYLCRKLASSGKSATAHARLKSAREFEFFRTRLARTRFVIQPLDYVLVKTNFGIYTLDI